MRSLLLPWVLLLVACGGDEAPESAMGTIGATGGNVTTPAGAALIIPAGALSSQQNVGFAATGDALPQGDWTASGSVYRATPDGLIFNTPGKVRLPVGRAGTKASIFWSRSDGTGYDDLGASRVGDLLEADIGHLGTGFVGVPDACFVGTCGTCADGSRCGESCTGCVYTTAGWEGCTCALPCQPCASGKH